MVARIIGALRDACASGTTEELSAVVARQTGYCETTVDHVIAHALFANEAALATLTAAVRGGIDEANRTFWTVATEEAA